MISCLLRRSLLEALWSSPVWFTVYWVHPLWRRLGPSLGWRCWVLPLVWRCWILPLVWRRSCPSLSWRCLILPLVWRRRCPSLGLKAMKSFPVSSEESLLVPSYCLVGPGLVFFCGLLEFDNPGLNLTACASTAWSDLDMYLTITCFHYNPNNVLTIYNHLGCN